MRKRSPQFLNNYRLISVISVIAKVFERIVYDQLHAYLEEHKIICKYQSDFRAIHALNFHGSTETTDTWAYIVDLGRSNATDTVDHEILLSKLITANMATGDMI